MVMSPFKCIMEMRKEGKRRVSIIGGRAAASGLCAQFYAIAVAFAIIVGLAFLYAIGGYISRLKCTQRYPLRLLRTSSPSVTVELPPVNSADVEAKPARPKSRRLRSLDTFRGFLQTSTTVRKLIGTVKELSSHQGSVKAVQEMSKLSGKYQSVHEVYMDTRLHSKGEKWVSRDNLGLTEIHQRQLRSYSTMPRENRLEISELVSVVGDSSPRAVSIQVSEVLGFRLALTAMVFVNYGGGGYWFFEHAPWNGLTVADLVMPWFVFIIGTSVALSFGAMLRRGIHRLQLLRKLTWRTVILLLIGAFYINYGPTDGPFSWERARIPGVLQRLGFTYFVVALMETCCATKELKQYMSSEKDCIWAPVRDILIYWPEWIFMLLLETLWLCLTFLLPVPGCPRGYLGAGGIGEDGKFPNCTGGAAAYIDKWLLGVGHIYSQPTCKQLYHTTEPFDPEGVLGTINSVLMAFMGLQAGKIVLIYRPNNLSILKRFLIWAVILGFISAVLTKCEREGGFIPVNKNLWSLSFITTTGCFSFILLSLMYYIIDMREWWGGEPFIFPGMNSIFVYVGHSVLGWYFPFSWEMKHMNTHAERLFQDLLGTAIWVFIAFMLYRKKFFLKI
ncbi:heparan-alpha-glucosaminide N-acetyltransferase [Mustelus asterias]